MRRMQIIGNLTKDAEIKNISNTNAITFSVAVNEIFKNKNGEKVDKAYYYDCTIWRDDTKLVNYLTKGMKVYVEGSPEINVYQDKDGNHKGGVRIRVSHFEFLAPINKDKDQQSDTDRDFINGGNNGGAF